MTVFLYVVLGVVVGIPVYLFVGSFVVYVARFFAGLSEVCCGKGTEGFYDEMSSNHGSLAAVFGRWEKIIWPFEIIVSLVVLLITAWWALLRWLIHFLT